MSNLADQRKVWLEAEESKAPRNLSERDIKEPDRSSVRMGVHQ